MKQLALLICFFLVFPFLTAQATPAIRYEIDSKQSEAHFTSKAPMETVVGKTSAVTGWVEVDLRNIKTAQVLITVDPNAIKTGNRLRDKDMRDRFLETKKNPQIQFQLSRIVSGPGLIEGGKSGMAIVEGMFHIHGVQRKEQITVQITPSEDQTTLNVQSRFSIHLADYQVERPKFLWMKLSDQVEIFINLVLKNNNF